MQKATAPATEKIANSYNQEKSQLATTMPRGGARDLALEETDISKAGAVGSVEANAVNSAPAALAQLAGTGIGLSTAEVSAAISAFGGASSSNQAASNMSGAGKAQTLGFIGGLAGDAAKVGSAAIMA